MIPSCHVNLNLVDAFINVYPAGNYIFKVNNRNTTTRYEMCSKLSIMLSNKTLGSFQLTVKLDQLTYSNYFFVSYVTYISRL